MILDKIFFIYKKPHRNAIRLAKYKGLVLSII